MGGEYRIHLRHALQHRRVSEGGKMSDPVIVVAPTQTFEPKKTVGKMVKDTIFLALAGAAGALATSNFDELLSGHANLLILVPIIKALLTWIADWQKHRTK